MRECICIAVSLHCRRSAVVAGASAGVQLEEQRKVPSDAAPAAFHALARPGLCPSLINPSLMLSLHSSLSASSLQYHTK